MINRILLILKTQNLSSSQFADEIGVQRSSISHILSGRNNPSLEFVTKILKRFPEINSDWIIFGKGSMYRGSDSKTDSETKEIRKNTSEPDLFNLIETEQVDIQAIKTEVSIQENENAILNEVNDKEKDNNTSDIQINKEEISHFKTIAEKEEKKEIKEKEIEIKKIQKEIEKFVIFYSDKTFREYFPE